jgi:hypothetical protein
VPKGSSGEGEDVIILFRIESMDLHFVKKTKKKEDTRRSDARRENEVEKKEQKNLIRYFANH